MGKLELGKSKTTLERLLRALIELAGHAALLIVVLGLFRLVQRSIEYLWGGKDVRFFDAIPLRYIFDGADLIMLLGLLSIGVYNGVQAYRGKE
jgi:hypothetical protein